MPKDNTVRTTQPSAFIKRALIMLIYPPTLALCIIVYFVSLVLFHTDAARDDAYRAFRNGSLVVEPPSVLINDSRPNSDRLTANLLSTPNHGSLTFQENGSFVYVPEINFIGEDSFVYEAINGTFSDTATVTITITPKPIALAH